jgi:hypothetical protein
MPFRRFRYWGAQTFGSTTVTVMTPCGFAVAEDRQRLKYKE